MLIAGLSSSLGLLALALASNRRTLLPVQRALRTDPMSALRYE